MFDLERVEVLRGPQGTLFGRNTTGGAINFITRKPLLDGTNGYVDLGYGNFNDVRAEGAVELTPVEGVFGVRAAVSFDRHDGYIDNKFPGGHDLLSANNLRSRLSARFKPSDNLDINLRLFANRAHQYQPGIVAVGTGAGGSNPFTGYSRAGLDFYDIESDTPHLNKTNSEGAGLTIKWRLSDTLSLQTLTSYDTAKSLFGQDVDGIPQNLLQTYFDSKYEEYNQEVRLIYDNGPIKAQGGAFYGHDRVDITNSYLIFQFLEGLGAPADPTLTTGGATIVNHFRQVRSSKAIFGQADIEPVENLTLTLGARYTWDTAKYENGESVVGDYHYNPLVQVIGTPGNPLNRSGKNKALTGRAAISYKFAAGPLVYASYSRGYRAGTFNGAGYLDASQITFVAPERVNAYEVGIKGRFFDNALTISAAGFYYDYTNQQIQDQVGPVAFLRNAGSSTLKGGEVEASWKIATPLTVSGSIGYTDSKYKTLTLQGIVLDGKELPFAPVVTATGRIDYTIADVLSGDLTFSPSVTYTSRQWFTPYNDVPGYAPLQQGKYALIDGVVEWKKGDWAVRAWARNLTNRKAYAYGANLVAFGAYYFNQNQPRTFGVAVHRNF